MAEEKKEFEKTKELSVEEVQKIVNTDFGAKITMGDVKAGCHIIMQILGPVEVNEYTFANRVNTSHTLKCLYKPKGYDGFKVQVQVGEGAAKRLMEKFPNNTYVEKYAFFSRTSYNGTFPQFINPIDGYSEPKDKDELFKKKESTKKDDVSTQNATEGTNKPVLDKFDKFKGKYLEQLKGSKKEPNAIHMLGSFVATYEKERVTELLEKCKEAVK